MKKVMKAAVAAGAAGALLLGGVGTLALWNADANVNAGTVTTGHLTMTTDAAEGVWTETSEGVEPENAAFNPLTDRMVPGDVLTFKQNVIIGASGKNLKALLSETGLTGGTVLPAEVTVALAVDDSAIGVSQDEGTGVITFGAEDEYTVPVTVTVTFSDSAVGTMKTPVDLGELTLTLNQVR